MPSNLVGKIVKVTIQDHCLGNLNDLDLETMQDEDWEYMVTDQMEIFGRCLYDSSRLTIVHPFPTKDGGIRSLANTAMFIFKNPVIKITELTEKNEEKKEDRRSRKKKKEESK